MMNKRKFAFVAVCLLLLFFSCKNGNNTNNYKEAVNRIADADRSESENELVSEGLVPVSGYRFVIEGDFNGDGKKEKLTEHYFSGLDKKETNKFYENLPDYEELVTLTIQKKPYIFITSDDLSIDTLHVTSNEQQLGLSYLKNEGDLNGDGTDEISYVVNWADWSSCNTWYIMTYRNSTWEELYSFPIWDWQLPDLPETYSQYGLMGLQDKSIRTDDIVNEEIDSVLNNFEGLVKRLSHNRIQVIYSNEEAELDSVIVDLSKTHNHTK